MEQISENKRRVRLLGLKSSKKLTELEKLVKQQSKKEVVNLRRVYWM